MARHLNLLSDGLNLAENLRELNRGVQEISVVDQAWFDELQSWAGDTLSLDDVFSVA